MKGDKDNVDLRAAEAKAPVRVALESLAANEKQFRKEEQKTTKGTKRLRKLRKRHPFLSSFSSVEL